MSWKFGGLVIKKDFSKNLEGFFELIGRSQQFSGTTVSFREALNVKASQSAVGSIKQSTLLLNEYLPYDCSFTAGKESAFDKKLASVSNEGALLAFFLDGTSGTYGFSFFESGERKRQWASTGEEILCNEGDFLPVESAFIAGIENTDDFESEEEARIIRVLEEFIEADFSMLVKNDNLKFFLFT